jgi:Mg/Co/Ni transporter MgtE
VTARLDERLGEVSERAAAVGLEAAVVVNEERVVLGLLRTKELAGVPEQPIEHAMRPGPSTFRPYVAIAQMAALMVEHNLDSSPITTSDGKLVGLLMTDDAVRVAHELHLSHESKDKAS